MSNEKCIYSMKKQQGQRKKKYCFTVEKGLNDDRVW